MRIPREESSEGVETVIVDSSAARERRAALEASENVQFFACLPVGCAGGGSVMFIIVGSR